jgi:hypothetical protein
MMIFVDINGKICFKPFQPIGREPDELSPCPVPLIVVAEVAGGDRYADEGGPVDFRG